MALYEIDDPGPLVDPVLLVALDGWVNAGSAGTLAVATIGKGATEIGRFRSDALFDYRQNRPTVEYVEGVLHGVKWPKMTLRHRSFDGRSVLTLIGTEPNWHWKQLSVEIAALAGDLGVVEHVSLGGIPWAAPHTRPVSIVTTASSRERLGDVADHPEGVLRVPGSGVNIIEEAVMARGIPTIGYWARVPHYVGSAYHAAALALVQRVSGHLGIVVDLEELAAAAAEQRVQLDAAMEGRPEVKTLVQNLESMLDDEDTPMPTGEDLAAEIERFLRQQGDGRA